MIAVGAGALHVERILMGKPRLVERTTITGETRCQWIDGVGRRFWKAGRRNAPHIMHRYLMTHDEYLAAGGVL